MAPAPKKKPGPKKGSKRASASRKQGRGSSPVHPNVDITKTVRWPKVKEGAPVTPVEAVILKRQDAMATMLTHVNQRILHTEELSQAVFNKLRGRKTTAKKATAGDEPDEDEDENEEANQPDDAEEDSDDEVLPTSKSKGKSTAKSKATISKSSAPKPKTPVSLLKPSEEVTESGRKAAARTLTRITAAAAKAQSKALVQGGELFPHLMREYRNWIENGPIKKKPYLYNSGQCADDAMEFVAALGTLIDKELRDSEHHVDEIHSILSGFQKKFVAEIYINCGFELKELKAREAETERISRSNSGSSQSSIQNELPSAGRVARKAMVEARKKIAQDSQSSADRPADDGWHLLSSDQDLV